MARAVGHPEWLADHSYSTAAGRAQNARELIAELDSIFATKTLDEWAGVFAEEADFFWSPINTVDDVLADPQLAYAGGLVVVPDESSGTTMVASPADFHGTPWAPRSLAPKLGEHTREVLAQLGKTDDAIATLLTAGIAVQSADD